MEIFAIQGIFEITLHQFVIISKGIINIIDAIIIINIMINIIVNTTIVNVLFAFLIMWKKN